MVNRIPSRANTTLLKSLFQPRQFSFRTLTSFYLPSDTIKVLHVEGDTTTADVIRNLLKKFRVVDNPHKFALYVKRSGEIGKSEPGRTGSDTDSLMSHHQHNTLGRVRMRRLNDAERPLLLALSWKLGKHFETFHLSRVFRMRCFNSRGK